MLLGIRASRDIIYRQFLSGLLKLKKDLVLCCAYIMNVYKPFRIYTFKVLIFISGIFGTAQCFPNDFSRQQISEIVNAHNYFRSRVSPTAVKMLRLDWNDTLASEASEVAMGCVRNSMISTQLITPSSINTAVSASSTPNLTNLIERGWFNQLNIYNATTDTCTSEGACSEYINMINASISQLGCGSNVCPLIPNFPVPDSTLFICIYNLPDIGDYPPYVVGESCAACEDACKENLCVSQSQISTTLPEQISTDSSAGYAPIFSTCIFLLSGAALITNFYRGYE